MTLGAQRILTVTGKGGVGKTTTAVALGLEAARRGLRTVLAETSGSRRVPGLFGKESQGYTVMELVPGLSTLSITPMEAMEDYIVQQVKIRKIYEMVFQNRVMGPFVEAVPGLHDAVQLGKIFDLARETRFGRKAWDLIIVDAPATGHGLSLLASARNMMDLTRGGPLYEGSKLVSDVVDDPTQSGVVLVSLPEEMPVNETLELYRKLGDAQARVCLQVLNQVAPAPFAHSVDWAGARAALLATQQAGVGAAVHLADSWLNRCAQQRAAAERLTAGIPAPLLELPQERTEPDLLVLRDLGARLGAALSGAA